MTAIARIATEPRMLDLKQTSKPSFVSAESAKNRADGQGFSVVLCRLL